MGLMDIYQKLITRGSRKRRREFCRLLAIAVDSASKASDATETAKAIRKMNAAIQEIAATITKTGVAETVEEPPSPISSLSKKTSRLEFAETSTGNYFLPADATGDIIANAIKNNQIFEPDIYHTAKKLIRPGTVALDVGSNFGQMAILMAKHVGDNGMVHAFEADPFVYGILCKNIESNQARVTPHSGAVHSASGKTLYFPEQEFTPTSHQSYGSFGIDYAHNTGRPIQTIALDDIDYGLPVSFVKIDIQGGDLFALKGMTKLIDRYRMPILFEYEYSFEISQNLCFQEYVDFVRDIGYVFHRVIHAHNFLILPKEKQSSEFYLPE